jgi:oxygen-independent coproporphyrinogen-3 oxidase
MPVGLYIHVPFCRTRCHFCAFYLQIHREDNALAYLEALEREIRLHEELNTLRGRTPETLYFGGGTPTMLSPDQLGGVVTLVRTHLGLREQAEVTLEAHPDTVTAEGLRSLFETGITRISFGAQSMDNEELLRIGRPTPAENTRMAVEQAREAGFLNISLDLIYGLPDQTLERWLETLEATIALEPTHLSCYALTVEEKTRFQIDLRRGDHVEPDPALQVAMDDAAGRRLAEAGFHRYEISNYSRNGYACRHNLLYWRGEEYLGFGPSAQSYLDGTRFGNVDDLAAYSRLLKTGTTPIVEKELLTPERQRREAVVFGLRLSDGLDLTALSPAKSDDGWEQTLHGLVVQGLVEKRGGWVRLTDLGRRYADTVAVALL